MESFSYYYAKNMYLGQFIRLTYTYYESPYDFQISYLLNVNWFPNIVRK